MEPSSPRRDVADGTLVPESPASSQGGGDWNGDLLRVEEVEDKGGHSMVVVQYDDGETDENGGSGDLPLALDMETSDGKSSRSPEVGPEAAMMEGPADPHRPAARMKGQSTAAAAAPCDMPPAFLSLSSASAPMVEHSSSPSTSPTLLLSSTHSSSTMAVPSAPSLAAPSKHPSGLNISQRRESYLRRYLKDQYPLQLQSTILAFLEEGQYEPFHKGDFVEVRARMQPGECKIGGLGFVKKVYTDHVHMYDIKYAIGGYDRMVDGNFLISRKGDDTSKPRKASPRCLGCGAFQHECRCESKAGGATAKRLRQAPLPSQSSVKKGADAPYKTASESKAVAPSSTSPSQRGQQHQGGRVPSLQRPRPIGHQMESLAALCMARSSDHQDDGDEDEGAREEAAAVSSKGGRGARASSGGGGGYGGGRKVVTIHDSSDDDEEEGEEEEDLSALLRPSSKRRNSRLRWSSDEEDDDQEHDSDHDRPPPSDKEGAEEEEEEEEEDESQEEEEEEIGATTLDEEAARQLSRSRGAREYARLGGAGGGGGSGDNGFIRGEGELNAERVPQEVKAIIRAKGLYKLDKKELATKVPGLLEECRTKLKKYKRRLRSKIEDIEEAVRKLHRQRSRHASDAGVMEELVENVDLGIAWVEDEMRLFTRETDDVLYYCMKRLRTADEEKYDPRVTEFVTKHQEVDRTTKDCLRDLRSRVKAVSDWRLEFNSEEGEEDDEDDEGTEGEEERDWEADAEEEEEQQQQDEEEEDEDVLLMEMTAGTSSSTASSGGFRPAQRIRGKTTSAAAGAGRKRSSSSSSTRNGRASGSSRSAGGGSGSGRGHGERKKRAKDDRGGDHTDGGGDSMDEFIVDDMGERGSRRRKRPRREHGSDGTRRGRNRERHQEDDEEEGTGPRDDLRHRTQGGSGGGGGGGGGGDGQRRGGRAPSSRTEGFGRGTQSEDDDIGDEGEADESYLFPLSDDEVPSQGSRGASRLPQVTPLGEDLEAVLSIPGAALTIPTLSVDLRADLSTTQQVHLTPADGDDDVMLLGLPATLRSTWMAKPRPFLPTVLLPRLLAHLTMLPRLDTPLPASRLADIRYCFTSITRHLRVHAYRYDTGDMSSLVACLRRSSMEIERVFCSQGFAGNHHKATASSPNQQQQQQSSIIDGLGPLLYSSMLDWFATLSSLEQQRGQQQTGGGGSATAAPATHFLDQLMVYLLQHLVDACLRNPAMLSLRLPLPDGEGIRPTMHRLSNPIPSLWCRILHIFLRGRRPSSTFWSLLLHVIRSQVSASNTSNTASWLTNTIRGVLMSGDLQQLCETMSASAYQGIRGDNKRRLAMDLGRTEHLWRLIFDLIRLEMIVRGDAAEPNTGVQEDKEREACWSIVEMLLVNSPLDVELSSSGSTGNKGGVQGGASLGGGWAERYGSQVCPHRYTMLLIHRLRTLIKAWGPPAELTARVWEALLQRSNARLSQAAVATKTTSNTTIGLIGLGPRPVSSSAWRWFREAVSKGHLVGNNEEGDETWSKVRAMLWDLTDRRLCDLDAFFFLPPPSLLSDLPSGEAVRRLVSKGCDEVLLLSSCLLERHMGCLDSPDLRRTFLNGLLTRLDSGGTAQLLGLHNLAMALLVLHQGGQAEQKVLVNFWRKLKSAVSQGRVEPSQHFERSLALAVQFLAQLGPSSETKPDFLYANTFFDTLMGWFDLTWRTPQEMETLASKQLVPPPRYPPVLRWSIVFGLVLCLQVQSRFPTCTSSASSSSLSLSSALSRLLIHYKDLDNASLGLALWAYRRLCPLPTAPSLGATCQLHIRLPVLLTRGPAAAPQANEANDDPPPNASVLKAWAPDAGLLTALNALVREAWMASNALGGTASLEGLTLTLHGLPSIRALSSALALCQATAPQASPPDCSLLRSSLDLKPSSYAERSSGALQLRLFAPCFYDAYLTYRLPTTKNPLLDGRGWDVLTSWIGLTVELSAGHRRDAVDRSTDTAGSIDLEGRPLRYLRERYWHLTSRLMACLRLPDEEGAGLLDPSGLGRDVPLGRLQHLSSSSRRTYEVDMALRLALLANLFLGVARGLQRLQGAPAQRRNNFRQRILKAFTLLNGSLRLFAPKATTTGSSCSSVLGGNAREFGYSVVSLLLRLCPDIVQDKMLDDLIPELFRPFFVGTTTTKDAAPPEDRTAAAADPTYCVQITSAADRLGDVMCCVAQVRYSRQAIVSWMRYFSKSGLFWLGGGRSVQTRAFHSLAHGLWHACTCYPSHEDEERYGGGNPVRAAMAEVVRLEAGSALVRQIERQAQAKVNAFRWRFLFELDLASSLDPAGVAGTTTTTSSHHHTVARIRFLRIFYSSACTCGLTPPTACPNNDIFPVLAPCARLLLLALDPEAGIPQAVVEDTWRLVLAIMSCPLARPPTVVAREGGAAAASCTSVVAWARGCAPPQEVGGPCSDVTRRSVKAVVRLWIDLMVMVGSVRVGGGGQGLDEFEGLELLAMLEEARKRFVTEVERTVEVRGRDGSTVARHVWGASKQVAWRDVLLGTKVGLPQAGAGGNKKWQQEEVETLTEMRQLLARVASGGDEETGMSQQADAWLERSLKDARR